MTSRAARAIGARTRGAYAAVALAALAACRAPERGTSASARPDAGPGPAADAHAAASLRAEDEATLRRFDDQGAPGLARVADVDLTGAGPDPVPVTTLRLDACVRALVLGEGRARVSLETGATPLADTSGELPLALAPSGVVCATRGRALALRVSAEHDGGAPPAPRRVVLWASSPEADGGARGP